MGRLKVYVEIDVGKTEKDNLLYPWRNGFGSGVVGEDGGHENWDGRRRSTWSGGNDGVDNPRRKGTGD